MIIDADRIGHELLSTPEISTRIRDVFGASVFSDGGIVDRRRLAERVFGSADQQTQCRRDLEKILHPEIQRETEKRILSVPEDVDAVILDAALLLEAGWADQCDALIFVDVPLEIRRQRVFASRGWSEDELARREAAQWPVDSKRGWAGFVVDNSGSLEDAAQQMKLYLKSIVAEFTKCGPQKKCSGDF